jgi:hypothetical protein
MTKFKLLTTLTFFGFALLLNSCFHCIDGNGTFTSEDRSASLNPFSQIELNGSYELVITQDSLQKLIIEGDENILPYITSHVYNNKLIVETESNKCINTDHPLRIKVSVATLDLVYLSGSGSIFCDSLITDDLTLNIQGSGNASFNDIHANNTNVQIEGSGSIYLDGSSTNTSLTIDGSGDIRANNLIQQKCYVEINGSGNIYTFFTISLSGEINGSGNIYYIGPAAKIDININGSGNIISNN